MVGKISCKQDNLVLDACFLVLCQKYLNNASYIFITAVLQNKNPMFCLHSQQLHSDSIAPKTTIHEREAQVQVFSPTVLLKSQSF